MSDDKKLNEVIRVQKRPNNFVMIDKGFLEDTRLSYKAKGILAYLLSKPDNWKVIVKDLMNHSTDGKAAVYSGLGELKELGYYEKRPVRDEKGIRISHWEGTVYECPAESPENTPSSLLTDFQEIDNQDVENQDIENRERNNNDFRNIDFNNNHSSQVMSAKEDGQDEKDTHAIELYTDYIKTGIGYTDFEIARPYNMPMVDEIVAIILDVVMTEGKTVRVGGEDKPRALVKSNLLKLTHGNVEYVIDQYKSQCGKITKKKQYLLTMLYNSKMETDAHYINLVESDKWQ